MKINQFNHFKTWICIPWMMHAILFCYSFIIETRALWDCSQVIVFHQVGQFTTVWSQMGFTHTLQRCASHTELIPQVFTHTRTHTHIRTHARTRTHTHSRTHTHTHTHARAHTHTHIYTHARAHTHTCARTHTHTHTHTYTHARAYTRTHTHTHTHTHKNYIPVHNTDYIC